MMLPASGTIAEYSDLRLEASKTTPVRFASRSGTLVELYALLPVDLDVRGIRVEIPGRGRFQLVGRAETTALACEEDTLRAIQGAGTRPRRDASKGPRLGPYPDGVVVVVTDDARREHRFPVR
jgi:hypothetical protein